MGSQPAEKKASTPGPRDERGVLAARILAEARASFAEHGYAGTTVRAVARAADVDPALVYHYYGSKESLLDAATTLPPSFLDQIVTAWQTSPAELSEQLVRQMLKNWQNPEYEPVLRAVVQIAGNEPAIRDKLSHIIERSMMGPSAQALEEGERALRSSLIASQLMGLAFMRFIWKTEPLATMDDDDVVAAIAPTIQRYLDGDVHSAADDRLVSPPSTMAAMAPANAPDPGKDRDKDPVRPEQSPEQSAEDTDAGWGEAPESGDDDRYYRDRPPHWGSD